MDQILAMARFWRQNCIRIVWAWFRFWPSYVTVTRFCPASESVIHQSCIWQLVSHALQNDEFHLPVINNFNNCMSRIKSRYSVSAMVMAETRPMVLASDSVVAVRCIYVSAMAKTDKSSFSRSLLTAAIYVIKSKCQWQQIHLTVSTSC